MKDLLLKFINGRAPTMTMLRIACFLSLVGGCVGCAGYKAFKMPGESWSGPLPEPDTGLERLSASLKSDVESICALGPRNFESYSNMVKGADLIEGKFKDAGLAPYRIDYKARPAFFSKLRGATKESGNLNFSNIVAEVRGREAARRRAPDAALRSAVSPRRRPGN